MIIDIEKMFKDDRQKSRGWTLLEDAYGPDRLNTDRLRFSTIAQLPDLSVREHGLWFRARELRANLGQRHAEGITEHQQELPEHLRGYTLVFTGTIWCSPPPKLVRYVTLMFYKREEQKWEVGSLSLRSRLDDRYRLVHLNRS